MRNKCPVGAQNSLTGCGCCSSKAAASLPHGAAACFGSQLWRPKLCPSTTVTDSGTWTGSP